MTGFHRMAAQDSVLALVLSAFCASASETVYFLVATLPGYKDTSRDSYVLPLSQQQDIDYARYLIAAERQGPITNGINGIRSIVGASCVTGKDGVNRNYLDPRFPEWSWHVSRFLEFGEIFTEVCDGWPTHTEYLCSNAAPDQQFEICYYSYTIVRELGPAPLMLSVMQEAESFEFYWSAPGTNYLYSLEASQSLDSTKWFAMPGVSWPLLTNHWTLARTNALANFYRVSATPALPPQTRRQAPAPPL